MRNPSLESVKNNMPEDVINIKSSNNIEEESTPVESIKNSMSQEVTDVVEGSDENPEKNKSKERLVKIVKLLVGLGMLGVVIHLTKLDSPEQIKKVLLADPSKLLIALLFISIAQILGIKRWQVLVQFLGINASFLHVTKLHFLGLFCNNLFTAMGGDLVKALYLTRKEDKYQSVLSVMLDRYVGLLVILIVASVAAFSLPNDTFHQNLAYSTWVILAGLITAGVTAFLFSDTVARVLEGFEGFLDKYKKHHWPEKIRELSALTKKLLRNYFVVSGSLLLSIVSQGFAILAVHQLSLAVGAQIDASSMFVIVPIVLLISVVPISPGGLGTREAAFTYLLTNAYVTYGIEKDFAQSAAALVALLWLVLNILISLPGAISYSMISHDKK